VTSFASFLGVQLPIERSSGGELGGTEGDRGGNERELGRTGGGQGRTGGSSP
jgi:hypothetical protein